MSYGKPSTEDTNFGSVGEMIGSLIGAVALIILAIWFGVTVVRGIVDPPMDVCDPMHEDNSWFVAEGICAP